MDNYGIDLESSWLLHDFVRASSCGTWIINLAFCTKIINYQLINHTWKQIFIFGINFFFQNFCCKYTLHVMIFKYKCALSKLIWTIHFLFNFIFLTSSPLCLAGHSEIAKLPEIKSFWTSTISNADTGRTT